MAINLAQVGLVNNLLHLLNQLIHPLLHMPLPTLLMLLVLLDQLLTLQNQPNQPAASFAFFVTVGAFFAASPTGSHRPENLLVNRQDL